MPPSNELAPLESILLKSGTLASSLGIRSRLSSRVSVLVLLYKEAFEFRGRLLRSR